jgi:hypothetical protein
MFEQMDPAMQLEIMADTAINFEHGEKDTKAAFMAAFTSNLWKKQRQTT